MGKIVFNRTPFTEKVRGKRKYIMRKNREKKKMK